MLVKLELRVLRGNWIFSYHNTHYDIDRNDECVNCHHTLECLECHINHMSNNVSCLSCHNSLPSPNSHSVVKDNFNSGNHSSIESCNTCHSSDKLKVDPYAIDLNQSNDLCCVCHLSQMNNISQNEYVENGSKCVECHDPHTTYYINYTIFASNAMDSGWHSHNKTSIIYGIKKILFSKNGFIISILFILGITLASHRFIPERENDMKILTHNLMTIRDKDHIKVVHIKISDPSVVDKILESIERMDIKVLSTTIKKPKHGILEIFLDFSVSAISYEMFLKVINKFENVISAEYSDDNDGI